MSEPEFVTLQVAAGALGLSVRQVSRLVSRLASDDVRRSPGRPTTCSLEALCVLRHDAGHGRPSETLAEKKPKTPTQNTAQNDAGHVLGHDACQEENVARHESDLVSELRADRDAWKAQAEKALQLVDQAQQLQLVAERKVAELEGKLLPAVEQTPPPGAPAGYSGEVSAPGGGIVPPPTVEAKEKPLGKLRAWLRSIW